MAQLEVWFNPSCSKARSARDELAEAGENFVLRDYREQPPTVAELEALLAKLSLQPWDICRAGEKIAKELGLADWPRDASHRQRWLTTLSQHPILIQRPIVIAGDRAVVAREAGWRARLAD